MGKSDNFFIREKIGRIPQSIIYSAIVIFTVILLLLGYLLFFFHFDNEYTGQCTFNPVTNGAEFTDIPEQLIKKIEIGDTLKIVGNGDKPNALFSIANLYANEKKITANYISPNLDIGIDTIARSQKTNLKVRVVIKKLDSRLIHQILSR